MLRILGYADDRYNLVALSLRARDQLYATECLIAH